MEICMMIRKCLVFASSAGVLLGIGVLVGPGLSKADDDETPLGKIMEKVNKHNTVIQKGVRNKVAFAKAQKDVEKSAKELVKLAKEAKNDQGCRQEGQRRGQSREEVGRITSTSWSRPPKSSARSPAKSGATFQDAKDAFGQSEEGLHRLPQGLPSRRKVLNLSVVSGQLSVVADIRSPLVGRPIASASLSEHPRSRSRTTTLTSSINGRHHLTAAGPHRTST